MRIALLSWESLHSIAVGGVAAHVSELAAALARRGHQVHVFTRGSLDQRCHDWIDGVHYHRCVYRPDGDLVDDVNNMCRSIVDRVFEVEDLAGRFDLIHAHDWLAANAMIWVKQGRGHTCLLTIHSTEYARCGNAFPNGQADRIRCQERAGTYWADRVIAVSHATGDEIAWMYEVPRSKIAVIYNGVRPERFDRATNVGADKRQHDLDPMDPTILFCGRLAWQKGPDLLVDAVPQVLRQHPSAKFLFVGDGDMQTSLRARTRDLDIGHAVRFLGYRNGDELVRLYKMADALCLPSRNEPFGIVVLEAWSAGKPVIASQSGGAGEYVQHEVNGLKIYPAPDSVAWGINRAFSDFDRARWMGDNGRKTVVERFTWDTIADQTVAVYEDLCVGAAAHSHRADGRAAATTCDAGIRDPAPRDAVENGPASPREADVLHTALRIESRLRSGVGALESRTDDTLALCRSFLGRPGPQSPGQNGVPAENSERLSVFQEGREPAPCGCRKSPDAGEPDEQPQATPRDPFVPSDRRHSHRRRLPKSPDESVKANYRQLTVT